MVELMRGDPSWWGDVLGDVAQGGVLALREAAQAKGWAWNAMWGMVQGDSEMSEQYDRAHEAFVQLKAAETLLIADEATVEDVQVAKLRSENRFRYAGKVDRSRWGDKVDVRHGGMVPTLVIEIAAVALPVALPEEKVVAQVMDMLPELDEI